MTSLRGDNYVSIHHATTMSYLLVGTFRRSIYNYLYRLICPECWEIPEYLCKLKPNEINLFLKYF